MIVSNCTVKDIWPEGLYIALDESLRCLVPWNLVEIVCHQGPPTIQPKDKVVLFHLFGLDEESPGTLKAVVYR